MGTRPDAQQSNESKSNPLEDLQREIAAIQHSRLCNHELEAKLARRYARPISQGLIPKNEIWIAVAERQGVLARSEVTQMLNLAPGLREKFVGPNVSDFSPVPSESKMNEMMAELDWVDRTRLLATVSFGGYCWDDAETDALRGKVFETETELRKMGALFEERRRLAEILFDFLTQYNSFPHDQSLNCEEDSNYTLLEPVASYIRQPAVHNDYTTKYLLTSMFDLIDRQPRVHIEKCKKLWIFSPNNLLLYSFLLVCGLLDNEHTRYLVLSWWFVWLIFFGWSILRVFNYVRARLIHSKLKALMGNFSWPNIPITCDGNELCFRLRKIERLGAPVPSLLYALLRLAVPGADCLYGK